MRPDPTKGPSNRRRVAWWCDWCNHGSFSSCIGDSFTDGLGVVAGLSIQIHLNTTVCRLSKFISLITIYTVRCTGIRLRLVDETSQAGFQLVVNGGPFLGYTMDEIHADPNLLQQYHDDWAPRIFLDTTQQLSLASQENVDSDSRSDRPRRPSWLACPLSREPVFCMQVFSYIRGPWHKYCHYRVWVRGQQMEDGKLRYVRKGLYHIPVKATRYEALKRGPNAIWHMAPEGWIHNPQYVALLIRFLVHGNYRTPEPGGTIEMGNGPES